MNITVDDAWDAHVHGEKLTADQAAHIHGVAYEYGKENDHLMKVISLVQILSKEYARGERCSVCSETDDPRCRDGC